MARDLTLPCGPRPAAKPALSEEVLQQGRRGRINLNAIETDPDRSIEALRFNLKVSGILASSFYEV